MQELGFEQPQSRAVSQIYEQDVQVLSEDEGARKGQSLIANDLATAYVESATI